MQWFSANFNWEELEKAPESTGLYDARELHWPPTNDRRRLWLILYRMPPDGPEDSSEPGLALAGACKHGSTLRPEGRLTPTAAYTLCCCMELKAQDDPQAPDEPSTAAGLRILREHNPDLKD